MRLRRERPSRVRRLSVRFLPGQGSTASGEADDGSAQSFQGGPVKQILEFPEPQMMEQLVDVPEIVVQLAVSSGEAGSSWPGEDAGPA